MKNILHLSDYFTKERYLFTSKVTKSGDRILHDHVFYEFFYVLSGHATHQLNGESYQLKTGDLCFLPVGDFHIFLREPDEEFVHRDIIINESLFKKICNNISPTFLDDISSGKYQKNVNISANTIKEFETKCENINDLILANSNLADTAINLFCYELCSTFFNNSLTTTVSNHQDWFYELLERFSHIDLLRAGIPEIIKPFYFTNEHICRVFKKYTGMTMTDYLNQRKIFEAANMLIYSNASISEIYTQLGISSASYFNKLFKKQYHTTPLKFRKNSEAQN